MAGKAQHYGKLTWAMIAWSAIFLVWIGVSAIPVMTASCSGDIFEDAEADLDAYLSSGSTSSMNCTTIDAHGGKFGALLSIVLGRGLLWALGIGVIAVVAYVIRRNGAQPAVAAVESREP